MSFVIGSRGGHVRFGELRCTSHVKSITGTLRCGRNARRITITTTIQHVDDYDTVCALVGRCMDTTLRRIRRTIRRSLYAILARSEFIIKVEFINEPIIGGSKRAFEKQPAIKDITLDDARVEWNIMNLLQTRMESWNSTDPQMCYFTTGTKCRQHETVLGYGLRAPHL